MEYGLFGKKYVLRTFEEELTKEEVFENEQELLKQAHERKIVLVSGS